MTEQAFLHELSKVKRFKLREGLCIRQVTKKNIACPLSAVANKKMKKCKFNTHIYEPAEYLGINQVLAKEIADAADYAFELNNTEKGNRLVALRKKLLKACKLDEKNSQAT